MCAGASTPAMVLGISLPSTSTSSFLCVAYSLEQILLLRCQEERLEALGSYCPQLGKLSEIAVLSQWRQQNSDLELC